MKFKRGSDISNGELQTAAVVYRKRFPWSNLYPFFQVDLVSTIHIADKEHVLLCLNMVFSFLWCCLRLITDGAGNWYHADLGLWDFQVTSASWSLGLVMKSKI
ncbi:hypothetical protein NC653_016798 [Populus alba x Populus x berolinensis]|uniref:Uncharacterized protein n=1 Tax=Populus alba x Populus x berolinensis TaxID=444605 RepID=A0AAD6QNQ5_9ROSI|nr:hypothetical protein NC653_016798 [Populus alba x Populus x berolinensis]